MISKSFHSCRTNFRKKSNQQIRMEWLDNFSKAASFSLAQCHKFYKFSTNFGTGTVHVHWIQSIFELNLRKWNKTNRILFTTVYGNECVCAPFCTNYKCYVHWTNCDAENVSQTIHTEWMTEWTSEQVLRILVF